MPTLTVETVRTDGVTFVEGIVHAERPHEVRIESRLDGPVWPPRRGGRPLEGWDERGVTTEVEVGRTPFGFATTAPPDDVAAEIVSAEPIEEAAVPAGVAAWLRRVDDRIETAESLATAEDLPAATRTVAGVGSLADVEALEGDLTRDRRALARLSFVPDELAARAESVDVPTEAFARLAQTESRRS